MEIGNSGDRKHIEIKTKIHFDFPIYHSYIGMVDICTVWSTVVPQNQLMTTFLSSVGRK